MNNVILTGRLTRDPELRYTTNNKAVCSFDIAANRTYTNEAGEREADFISCQIWGTQAENLKKYQSKGSLIAVAGSLRVDKYQTENGENRYKTYVLATSIEYLSTKVSEEVSKPTVKEVDPFKFETTIAIDDNDLPF
jgi:single-strand DNA-binding protein